MQKESSLLVKNLDNLPIWAKQVIVKDFMKDIEKKIEDFFILTHSKKLFQHLVPTLTVLGKKELQEQNKELSDGCYDFMKDVSDSFSIFDITIRNNWTLADSVKIFIKLYNLELIQIPQEDSNTNIALALFISGQIKIGEFLKKIGKIDATQLEKALRYQKELNNEGRHVKMASILIKMGFISNTGLDSLLTYKDEAKRRVPMSIGLTSMKFDNKEEEQDYIQKLQREIGRLENENLIMKKRLKTILKLD